MRGSALLVRPVPSLPARPIERVAVLVGVGLIAAGLFHLGVQAVLGGPWEGPVSWRKPTTFGLSFGLTLLTVMWVTSYVQMSPRRRAVLLGVFTVDCVVEVAGITLQAWRRVPSHFNTETPANTAVAMMLAVGGAVLVVVLVAFAVAAFRGDPGLSPSMRLAVRAGFVTLLIGLASGAAMIARGVSAGEPRLAYQLGGFLKPVHGVSLHGVLVLPALAWLLASVAPAAGWTEERRTRVVRWAVAAYGVAIAGALVVSLLN